MADKLNKDERMARARKARKGGKRTTRSKFRIEAKDAKDKVSMLGEMFRKIDADEFIRIATEHGLGSFTKFRYVRIITANKDW